MDADHFDSLTRSLVTRSRRGILSALAAAIGGAVIEDEARGKRKHAKQRTRGQDRARASDERVAAEKRKKKKKKKKGGGQTATVLPPGCNPPCPTCQVCQAGQCVNADGAACGGGKLCQGGVCSCPSGQEDSGGVCGVRPTCLPPGTFVGAGGTACCSGDADPAGNCSCSLNDERCQTNNDCCELARPCVGFVCANTCYHNYPHDPACQGWCPASADYCKTGTPTCSRDGFCLQPFDGGPSRCGRHDGSNGTMCNCTSHQECETRTGQKGAFCAKISGSNCRCRAVPQTGDNTFCVSPR